MIYNSYRSITHIFEAYGYYDYLDPRILNEMSTDVSNYLIYKKYNETEVKKYLAVNILANKRKDRYEIVAYNMISALWMSNVFPKDLENTNRNNYYETDDKIYKFNPKTNKLKVIYK